MSTQIGMVGIPFLCSPTTMRPSTLFSDFAVDSNLREDYRQDDLARSKRETEESCAGCHYLSTPPSLSQTARLEVEYSDTINNVTTCNPRVPYNANNTC
jgi:hypothetical protein